MAENINLTGDQIESLLVLINREVLDNEKKGDEAYNTHWENIKGALLEGLQ